MRPTKNHIVASSCDRSVGPITGSTCYTNTAHNVLLFDRVGNLNKAINRIGVKKVVAYFDKFGNENKERCEKRQLLSIFPIVQNYKIEDLPNIVNSFIAWVDKKEFKLYNWTGIENKLDAPHNTDVCFMVPTHDMVDLLKCPSNEYKAWLYTVISDKALYLFCSNLLGNNDNQLFKDMLDMSVIEKIYSVIHSWGPETMTDFILYANKPDNKATVISNIMKLFAIEHVKSIDKLTYDVIDSFKIRFIIGNDIINSIGYCSLILKYIEDIWACSILTNIGIEEFKKYKRYNENNILAIINVLKYVKQVSMDKNLFTTTKKGHNE